MRTPKPNIFLFNIIPCLYYSKFSDVLDFARSEGYMHINGILQWKAAFAIPELSVLIKGNALVKTLDQTVNKWDDRLFFYVFNDPTGKSDTNFRCINWRSPGTFQCSKINSPTFTNVGVAGNGSSAYLNTHCVPSTHVGKKDDASIGVWIHNNIQESGVDIGAYDNDINNALYLQTRSTLDALTIRVNDNLSLSIPAINTSVGYSSVDRTASHARAIYKNGSLGNSDSQASQDLSSSEFYICATNNAGKMDSPSTKVIKQVDGGKSKGCSNDSFYNALNTYMS
jgi:hypothetical protein